MTGALKIQAWKEARALLPWWGAMVVTIIALGEIGDLDMLRPRSSTNSVTTGVLVYILGSVALGALSIGHEYSHRALPMLLARPISRARMLATKLGILAVLLAALGAIAMWQLWTDSYVWRRPWAVRTFLLLPPIGALFLTPWLTMISRGPLAGAVFSIAAPLIVYSISVRTHANGPDAMNFAVAITLGLVAIGGVSTWRSFLRLEAMDGPDAEIGVPTWLRRPVPSAEWSSLRKVRVGNPVRLVLRKELHLQQMTIFVAAAYVTLWGGIATARSAVPAFVGLSFDFVTVFYCAVVSLMAGAVASAEERQLGTSEWQALLPLAAWKQWTLKVSTAFALALALGLVLPLMLAALPTPIETLPFDWEWAFAIVIICAGALYVSSLNTSGMRAFLATFPVAAGVVLVGALFLGPVSLGATAILQPIARSLTPFRDLEWRHVSQVMTLAIALPLVAGFGLVLLRFAGTNHRSADRSVARIRHQVMWMLAYAIGAVLLFSFVNDVLQAGLRQFPR